MHLKNRQRQDFYRADILELAGEMKGSAIFLMTGAVPSFVYVGRKKKHEHAKAKEDLKLIYF